MDKTNKIILWVIIAVVIIGGIWYGVSRKPVATEKETIKIGAILPLTGGLANFGNDVVLGMNLFTADHSDLKIIVEDDKGEPKESLNAFKKLSSIDNISYFYGPFGPVASETVYSSQSEQEKKELTFIAMSMCAEQFGAYENMICNYPTPYYQLLESYRYPKLLGKESFYAIVANDAFGESILQMFPQISNELGLVMLGNSKVNVKDLEFYTIVDKAIQSNSQFIVIATVQPETNFKIIKELKEKGYQGMILSGGDFEKKLIKEFQDILEGVYLTGQVKIDFNPKFLSLYNKEHESEELNLYRAYGYMWAEVLYNLVKANPKSHFTITDVMDYVNLHSDDLAVKGIKYSQSKEIELPMKVLLVEDGELKEVFVSGSE